MKKSSIKMQKENNIYNFKQVENHKDIVEGRNYKYIYTYEKHERLKDKNKVLGVDIDRKNKRTYIRVKCPYCKKEYDIRLSSFKDGAKCKYCCNKYENSFACHIEQELGLNISDVWDFELNTTNPYYIWKSGTTMIYIKCKKHGSYKTKCSTFHSGHRCSQCSNERKGDYCKLTYEEVKKYIESFGYKLLSDEYINAYGHLLIQCPKGHIYKSTFANFKGSKNIKGHRCPYCSGCMKYSYEFVKEYFENFGYKLLSVEYMNCKEKLTIQCPVGHTYKTSFDNFKTGCRCPVCNVSKGEQRIIDWLKDNNIEYIYDEPYFNDLLSPLGYCLRPDFILPDYKIWIEYDGEFHYKNMTGTLEKIIIHDEIKNQYAKNNGWELIRIPYWDFDNIENILNKYIE